MHRSDPQEEISAVEFRRRQRWRWALVTVFALTLVVGLVRARRNAQRIDESSAGVDHRAAATASTDASKPESRPVSRQHRGFGRADSAPALSAEEIVSGKVMQFGRSRRELVRAIGSRLRKDVPPEVEKFFDAVESGKWEDIKAQWDVLAKHSHQYDSSTDHWEQMDPFWPAVLDAYGVAEQAHLWPAQKLLDYGNAILDSLRPGMVYVGGTDNGRWIPELLNETTDGAQHMIVTQNALADGRYADFVNTLYGDRMTTLTSEDSQRVFQEYIADAQKRLDHDRQFPDEPKQIREGEDVHVVDGKAQVSGQVAVMAINEKLLQTLMEKNPELSFAIQESFPFKSTYPDALPLGPLMELGARNEQNSFTAERAGQSVDYWRNAAQQVLSDSAARGSEDALRSYSDDAVAAANLLAAHNFSAEAEEAYRLSAQFWPANPESVRGLADVLAASGRMNEAEQVLENFSQKYPAERKALEQIRAMWKVSFDR